MAVKEAVQAVPTELLTNPAVLAKLGGETVASLPCHPRKAVSSSLVGVIITRTRVVRSALKSDTPTAIRFPALRASVPSTGARKPKSSAR